MIEEFLFTFWYHKMIYFFYEQFESVWHIEILRLTFISCVSFVEICGVFWAFNQRRTWKVPALDKLGSLITLAYFQHQRPLKWHLTAKDDNTKVKNSSWTKIKTWLDIYSYLFVLNISLINHQQTRCNIIRRALRE